MESESINNVLKGVCVFVFSGAKDALIELPSASIL